MWLLALRNLLRNRRRTLIAAASVAFGLMLTVTARNLDHGVFNLMLNTAITGTAGHVVVQAPGWQDERDASMVVPDSKALQASLAQAYPGAVVARRVMVPGLLTSPRGSVAMALAGVEPSVEAPIGLLDERIQDGAYLSDDDKGILIGWRAAEALSVGVGDKVVFMAQVGKGDVESLLFRVRGVYHTGSDLLDTMAATAVISTVQPLLPGTDPAHQVSVILLNHGAAPVDTGPAAAVAAPGLDVLTWEQALPALSEQIAMQRRTRAMMYSFIGLIVAVGVLNTVLMGAMERIREFGVLLSLGMRREKLAGLLMIEGLLLGFVGAAFGLVLAALLYQPLYVHGIDYGDLLANNVPVASPIDTVVRAAVDVGGVISQTAVAVGAAVVASLWPAWMAMRLKPVEAMRNV
jgi:putative ABC transport system permease protein